MQSLDVHLLDELAGFDAADGGRLVRELIDLFLADSPAHMRNMWTAFGGRDSSGLCASAHRFASSVEKISARRMAFLCAKLECCGQTDNLVDGQPTWSTGSRC